MDSLILCESCALVGTIFLFLALLPIKKKTYFDKNKKIPIKTKKKKVTKSNQTSFFPY